mgnify:CR=1 FL=1
MTEPTREPEKTQVEGLWEVFKTSGGADTRERLILHYSPLVKYVAGRVGAGLPRSVNQNDLAFSQATDDPWGIRDMFAYFETHPYFGPNAEKKIANATAVSTKPFTDFATWAKTNMPAWIEHD